MVESNDSKAQENVKKDPQKAADVFSLPHDQLGQLVESGVIQEVPEDYAKEIATNDTDQAVAGAKYNGKTYAFPFGIESQVLFYNKSKLLLTMLLTMKQSQVKQLLVQHSSYERLRNCSTLHVSR